MAKALDEFNSLWLPIHSLDDGKRLYHYTTRNGMKEILKSRALRCTHKDSLTDPAESKYGKIIIQTVLEEMLMEAKTLTDIHKEYLRALRKQVALSFFPNHDVYMASFCESGDLLSQWRSYKEHQDRFCIGFEFTERSQFSPTALETFTPFSATEQDMRPHFRKVIYNQAEQQNLVRKMISLVSESAVRSIVGDSTLRKQYSKQISALEALALDAANLLGELSLCFKSPFYRQEMEWRLVRVVREDETPEEVSFDECGKGMIPYRAIHLFDFNAERYFPMTELRFGPGNDKRRTMSSLRLYLLNSAKQQHAIKLMKDIKIKGSAGAF